MEDRVNVHLVVAGIKGFAAGIFTGAGVIDVLNNHLATPLTTAESADLSAIASAVTGQANNTAKLLYVVGKVEPLMIAAETGDISESKWRADLGI